MRYRWISGLALTPTLFTLTSGVEDRISQLGPQRNCVETFDILHYLTL